MIKNKILGFTEEIDQCGCCGKGNLKGTYAIEDVETGDTNYFGSVCAFKHFNLTKRDLTTGVKAAELANISIAKIEYQATPEYVAYTTQMNDRETPLENANAEQWQAITGESIRLGAIAREVKATICKKYNITKTYMVG